MTDSKPRVFEARTTLLIVAESYGEAAMLLGSALDEAETVPNVSVSTSVLSEAGA